MAKRQNRPQAQKDRAANRERYEAMVGLSANATGPRMRTRYDRNDFRRAQQNGNWEV